MSSFFLRILTLTSIFCTTHQEYVNIHIFVIFSSTDEDVGFDNLATLNRASTRVFDTAKGFSTSYTYRVTYTSVSLLTGNEATPLGIGKLFSVLKAEKFTEKSQIRQRFIVIVGRGAAINKAIVVVRAWSQADKQKLPPFVIAYDLDFFNHANIANNVFQLNQDRRMLVAPLLASTVLHKSNPKGGVVVLIHDVTLVGDQLYIAAYSLFHTLVLVTEEQSEDVVTTNLRNEIAPLLNTVLLSQTIPAAIFVVHVASARSVAKIFAAARRNSLVDMRFVWILADRHIFVGSTPNNETYLRPPVGNFLLPQNLLALHTDRRQLFDVAFNRLLNGLAKSIVTATTRVKQTTPSMRLWNRLGAKNSTSRQPLDISIAHMFEPDGSVLCGARRGGQRYYTDDARYVTAVQIVVDRLSGKISEEKVSVKNLQHNNMTTTTVVTTTLVGDHHVISHEANSSSTTRSYNSTDTSDLMVITDGSRTDDVIPHLLQVFISLGPPFLFEKPVSLITGECQGVSTVVCDRITSGYHDTITSAPLTHGCCSGLVPDLVRTLSRDLKVNARILISASGLGTTNVSVALDLLNRRQVDLVFTSDPYIGHHALSRYYTTDPYFTSSYAMLVAIRKKETSLFAFLSPFPLTVWIGIIALLAPLTAFSISQFEWHSPFGLNPWGRKRSTNYTLGSAINMVYALLFGHTIKTKCPKAWPSKWTQNFWAGFAIFVIASYTGNLASFLAKRSESVEFNSIYELRDSNVKVGVVREDPIINWLHLAEEELAVKLTVVNSLEEGVRRLRIYEFDVLIGELSTLRYWQLTDDASTCSTRLLPRTFADRDLAPAMLVDSQFRALVAGKMFEYKRTGEFEQLISKNRFVSLTPGGAGGTACGYGEGSGGGGGSDAKQDTQLTLSHANGLFLAMCAAVVACCGVLIAEHIAYYFIVPCLRGKRRVSFWRGFTLMYFSQRLYRIVNSEEVLRPSQVLKEMLNVVKRLEFSRIFQKSARKKRFRKITIAEFVQQVKDEKEKKMPDVVVQTRGIQRAKRAWKLPLKNVKSSMSSLSEMAAEGVNVEMHYRKDVIRALELNSQGTPQQDPRVSRWQSAREGTDRTPQSNRANKFGRLMKERVITDDNSAVSFGLFTADKVVTSLPDACNGSQREPVRSSLSDMTPALRWRWVRSQLSTRQGRARAMGVEATKNVNDKDINKIIAGRVRLESIVSDLLDQLEQVKRERDRLLLIHDIHEASSV